MIINAHSHILCEEIYGKGYWDSLITGFAKELGVSKDSVVKDVFSQLWASNASVYAEIMDDAGIDKVVINHPDYGMSKTGEAKWTIEEVNEWYVKQVAEHPDNFLFVAGIDPRRSNAFKLLDKAVNEWNASGIKIYPPCGFFPDDPNFDPFYKRCEELALTLHSHAALLTHPIADNKYANPIYLDSIAAKFPDLKILIVHFGGAMTTWSLKVLELMLCRSNLYTEFSTQQYAAISMSEQWLKLLRTTFDTPSVGDKIMFGSDWPYGSGVLDEKSWVEWVKNIPEKAKEYGLTFTKEEIDKILGGNAKKFFNL
jgi:predicted TIM-barrel fold metal-dependent hydrolase